MVVPVVKPTDVLRGRPNRSTSQRPAMVSMTAAAGEATTDGAFWSQTLVSQSAATAAGRPPRSEPEEARPRHRHQPGRDLARELLDDRDGGLTVLRHRSPEDLRELGGGVLRRHRPFGERRAVLDRELRRASKQVGRAGVRIGRPGLGVAGRVLVHLSLADCHGRVRLPSSRPRGRRSTPFGDRMDAPRLTNGACSRMSQANTFATSSRPPTVRPRGRGIPCIPPSTSTRACHPASQRLRLRPILPVRGTVRRAEASPSIGFSVSPSAAGP